MAGGAELNSPLGVIRLAGAGCVVSGRLSHLCRAAGRQCRRPRRGEGAGDRRWSCRLTTVKHGSPGVSRYSVGARGERAVQPCATKVSVVLKSLIVACRIGHPRLSEVVCGLFELEACGLQEYERLWLAGCSSLCATGMHAACYLALPERRRNRRSTNGVEKPEALHPVAYLATLTGGDAGWSYVIT